MQTVILFTVLSAVPRVNIRFLRWFQVRLHPTLIKSLRKAHIINIVAFKYVNGVKVTLAASKKIHATTLGGKYGVAKAVKLNKSKVKIKKGKTFKIKASEIKKDKKIKRHRAICYESSNTKIATVNSKGKIKAKKKGKCTIYVYAQNGVYKTVKVTVK